MTITACGTAYYAGLAAKYWFEQIARLPVEVDIASEFRYREAPMPEDGLAVVISQSGETADTLAALKYCTEQGQHTLGYRQCPGFIDCARLRSGSANVCRAGNRRCFDQGVHLSADRSGMPGDCRGAGAWYDQCGRERELVSALIGVPRHIAEI